MPMVDIEWLKDHVTVPENLTYDTLAQDLVRVGFEEESIHTSNIVGPIVVGYVHDCVEELQKNGKLIHFCHVDVGPYNPKDEQGNTRYRSIVCGAPNIAAGQKVVVALPSAVLPGDFRIEPRKTYGHMSEGMCASERELGLSDEHNGIILLKNIGLSAEEYEALQPGDDLLNVLQLNEGCLEINITPDRGYAFSYRGIAREYHHSTQQPFTDPVTKLLEDYQNQQYTDNNDIEVIIQDDCPINNIAGCDRFHAMRVDVSCNEQSPRWLKRRLTRAGMRSINPVVDVTNYVMLDLGQPMHAYDYDLISMPIVVRRAKQGETLVTLDKKTHNLSEEDLIITDSPNGEYGSRILGIAGVMGGLYAEVSPSTKRVLLEAAHFDPVTVARSARRHKTPSDASKRFERGVDPTIAAAASQLAYSLLSDISGAVAIGKPKDINNVAQQVSFEFNCSEVKRITALDTPVVTITNILEDIGCTLNIGTPKSSQNVNANTESVRDTIYTVTVPPWRPDLAESCDLVEEVARLVGYDNIPVHVPQARISNNIGLSVQQKIRRRIADELAQSGLAETLTYPFVGAQDLQSLQYSAEHIDNNHVAVANPLAGDKPLLRDSILSTLISCTLRNIRRGLANVAIYELGHVYIPRSDAPIIPSLPGSSKPSDEQLAQLDAGLPYQPLHVASIVTGPIRKADWMHEEQDVNWTSAVELVNRVLGRLGLVGMFDQSFFVNTNVRDTIVEQCSSYLNINVQQWHPGRTALVTIEKDNVHHIVGVAGELHPRVLQALQLPTHSCAFELDCDKLVSLVATSPVQVQPISTFPPVYQDLAFIVPKSVHAQQLQDTIKQAAHNYLEDITLFDVFTSSEQLGEDYKSLAFSLTLRAPDRTLHAEDIENLRNSIIQAAQNIGATLRA